MKAFIRHQTTNSELELIFHDREELINLIGQLTCLANDKNRELTVTFYPEDGITFGSGNNARRESFLREHPEMRPVK